MDSEKTARKREAGLQHQRDTEDRAGIGGNGQAPAFARSTAGNVAGSVNKLTEGTVARWTLP